MSRTIEHTGFARRRFDDVLLILERHGDEILEFASAAASQRSTAIVEHADQDLPGFDSSEVLVVRMLPTATDHHDHAWIEFSWDANRAKRPLANVEARIDIRPLIRRGPRATTELTLRARHHADAGPRGTPETALFRRRVVKASLHRLLESFILAIEDFEESATPHRSG